MSLAELFGRSNVPAWMSRTGFRLLDPVKALRQRLDFVRQLHDREALLPRERQRRFLMGEGWVAWPGPAVADFMRQFIAHNRMLQGGFVIEDSTVTLADIGRPVLTVVGEVDEIAPTPAVRAIGRAAPRAEIYEMALARRALRPGGRLGRNRDDVAGCRRLGSLAQRRRRAAELDPPRRPRRSRDRRSRGRDAAWRRSRAARRGGQRARPLARRRRLARDGWRARVGRGGHRPAPATCPARPAEAGDAACRSGLLLDEQAADHPEADFFLFEDRAYSHEAVKRRIDNVVRGLVSLGVRQGEHVGVLMATRPSGLTVVAALNRLGAVAVLMRPDGPVAHEAELGQVTRIVADPELADRAAEAPTVRARCSCWAAGERIATSGRRVIDMERIDPDLVELPAWYRANPGRASDLAFILFTGEGERTRANRITNGRWALSAFATASAAALSDADTIYAVTPIYHPSGLLMSMGGAIAGGSRLAIARDFDPATFWAEVRRYGITVASYTWTMLREIANAPDDPAEHHHPVRLFIGAGMPRGLWRRVARRFSPATILEFYASTEGDAILVNLSGEKPGVQGSAACRAAPRSGSPPTTSPMGGCARVSTGSPSSVARARSECC